MKDSEETWMEYFLLRWIFFWKPVSKITYERCPYNCFFFLFTMTDLSDPGLSFLFGKNCKLKVQLLILCSIMKPFRSSCFQNQSKFSNLFWNSESCCETSLLYWRILSKILNKPLSSSTSTSLKEMEERMYNSRSVFSYPKLKIQT